MTAPAAAHALLDRMWPYHGTSGVTIRRAHRAGASSLVATGGQTMLVQVCDSSEPGELLAYTRPPWEKLADVPDQYDAR